MDRYLIESPHTDQECVLILNDCLAAGFLRNFEWGCDDDIHCGWAIIEAENHEQASLAVPPLMRKNAKIVKLVKYTDEYVAAIHKP